MNGLDHISQAFKLAKSQGRAALMPYFTLGYPTQGDSLAVVQALAATGADLIELGIPFSDPLADGQTIQHSTQVALKQGMTVSGCLEMVRLVRLHAVAQPLLLMGYINPLLSYGIHQFIKDASHLGADGLILPDLPAEEAGEIEALCHQSGLALVYLMAPNTSTERIRLLAGRSTGFLYLVARTGVTGAQKNLSPELHAFVVRVREQTNLPLAVGFGISTPKQVKQVSQIADGVIIGSALISAVGQSANPYLAARDFMAVMSRSISPIDVNI